MAARLSGARRVRRFAARATDSWWLAAGPIVDRLDAFRNERADRRIDRYLTSGSLEIPSGPFAGMRWIRSGHWNRRSIYLAGAYEAELHPAVERLIAARPARVVDVGCAEGFYAVGLARRLPNAAVHAFDVDDYALDLCREVAELNGVSDRVSTRGLCSTADLEELSGRDAAVIMDCEGGELDLLRPDRAPSLSRTTLLVELHDFVDPSITETLLERFASSHLMELIDVAPRVPGDWPAVGGLSFSDQARALNERRPTDPHPMQWLLLTPNHGPA